MATFRKRGKRWQAIIRRQGHTKSETFATSADAHQWADRIEQEIDELLSRGIMQSRATIADLIDRYRREQEPRKKWGRSKRFDLARLEAGALGKVPSDKLTSHQVIKHFQQEADEGAGGVTVGARVGYLMTVLRTARNLWKLDVPLAQVQDARAALLDQGYIGKSDQRDVRVTDAQLERIIEHIEGARETALPVRDLLHFCLASAMRISEVCRIEWADLDEHGKIITIRDRKHPKLKDGNHQRVPLLAATGHDAFAIAMRQPRDSGRIFPYEPRTVSAYFTRACTALRIPEISLHSLRHEAISRLFEAGWQIPQVAIVSGHRQWSMLQRYTKLQPEDLHKLVPRA